MRPTNPAEVRAFLNRRATDRPRNEIPAVILEGETATIRLFDPIDSWGEWWGMSAKEFGQALDQLPSHIATIELLINSPGGDAFDGLAMVNVLRAHPARTVAMVQGLAASAASFIACAADELVMAPNSTLMIHEAWGVCAGPADDMLAFGAVLDKLSGNLAEIYATKSGASLDEIRAAMKAETWYTADEAVASGLADRVETYSGDDDDENPATNVLEGHLMTADEAHRLLTLLAEDPKIDAPVGDDDADPGTESGLTNRQDADRLALLDI